MQSVHTMKQDMYKFNNDKKVFQKLIWRNEVPGFSVV
jgi:hypothetical protein